MYICMCKYIHISKSRKVFFLFHRTIFKRVYALYLNFSLSIYNTQYIIQIVYIANY